MWKWFRLHAENVYKSQDLYYEQGKYYNICMAWYNISDLFHYLLMSIANLSYLTNTTGCSYAIKLSYCDGTQNIMYVANIKTCL